MTENSNPTGLKMRWSALRDDLPFLPKLDRMSVHTHTCSLEAVEFVRVAPVDETVMVPEAPEVSSEDVRAFKDWSDQVADQQRMWRLVGKVISGNRRTQTCPDCDGAKEVTCRRCSGSGKVDCSWCSGRGYRTCMSCGGSGHRSKSRHVTKFDGSSSWETERETCMSCMGSGRDRCSSCLGSGDDTCAQCHGRGQVTCETCSTQGTVDVYVRRRFVEQTVHTRILPVGLPGFPSPVVLPARCVELHGREATAPLDAEENHADLAKRDIETADARLFFVRKASTTVYVVTDSWTGQQSASYIEGEPTPILTIHRTVMDRNWTTHRERQKAFGILFYYLILSPVALGLSFWQGGPMICAGVALSLGLVAFLLRRNPIKAFRLAFMDVRCQRHSRPAIVRCSHCNVDLCHECLTPSILCPQCRQPISTAVTHFVDDGQWFEVQAADA